MTDDERPTYCGDPDCTLFHPPAELIEISGRALSLAANGERELSHLQVVELAKGWGSDGLAVGVHLWIDYLVENTALRDVDPERLGLGFGSTTTGTIDPGVPLEDVDSVPPPVRWAGRYLIAWLRSDEEQMEALSQTVQDDPAVATECVIAVLEMCALMVRNPTAVVRAGGGG